MGRTVIKPGAVKEDTLEDADGNTKILVEDSSDENKIRFDTAGAERMIITETGAVGIGTSSPDNTLHVKSPGTTHIKIESEAGSESALKLSQAGQSSAYVWMPGSTSDLRFYVGGADRMHIDNDGKIGIGTTDPGELLTLNATEPTILFKEGGTDMATIGVNSSDNILIENKTINKHIVFKVNDQGVVKEGFRLDGAVPEVVVNQTSESLVDFRVESDNNTHMLFVDGSADFVGINTSTPGSGLHIAHSISLPTGGSPKTGAYSLTATDFCIVADCNSSAFTVTLPSATDAMAGRIYTIKRMDSGNNGGSNMLTISRNGKNIDNVAGDVVLANLDALMLQCIGAQGGWIRIGQFLAPMP